MKRHITRLLPALLAGMFIYSGCAKQGVVKNDSPLASVAARQSAINPTNKTVISAKKEATPAVSANTTAAPAVSTDYNKSLQPSSATLTAELQKKLDKIYFDFDSSTLSDTARQTLTNNYEVLKQNPQTRIRVEGNCDERGSDEYNLALGDRRAHAAAKYLTALGLSGSRVSTISYGKEKPVDSGHDETAWSKNRRDEFVIISR